MKLKDVIYGILPDILLLCGFAFLSYGVYLIYKPAMYIEIGSILMFAFYPTGKNQPKKSINKKGT